MASFVWLGDEDPSVQSVTVFGHTFVKGEPRLVADKNKNVVEKLKGNPMFSTDSKADPIESDEPEPIDPEAGTEKAALKAELRDKYGVTMQGNPSLDTLRNRLSAEVKKAED
jgi:hypothetical protein